MKPTFAVHSYPWYIADWIESETRHGMTLGERGLYRELLDRCYKEGSIPDSVDMLCRLCACELKEFQKCWPKVRDQFSLTEDGRLEHARVNEVLEKLENWNESRRKGGRSRQRSTSGKAELQLTYSSGSGTNKSSGTSPSSSPTSTSSPSLQGNGLDDISGRMIQLHANKSYPDYARHALVELVENLEDPVSEALNIEAAHKAWVRYWRENDKEEFEPRLDQFLRGGTWKNAPPKPSSGSPWGSQPHPAFIRSAL